MRLPLTPGSYEPGSMADGVKRGNSISSIPKIVLEKCTQCLVCWVFCPDSAVAIAGQAVEINVDFCKGCGICATECPEGAISMVKVS